MLERVCGRYQVSDHLVWRVGDDVGPVLLEVRRVGNESTFVELMVFLVNKPLCTRIFKTYLNYFRCTLFTNNHKKLLHGHCVRQSDNSIYIMLVFFHTLY